MALGSASCLEPESDHSGIDELEKNEAEVVPEDEELATADSVAEENDAEVLDEVAPPSPVVLLTWSQIASGADNELLSSTATLAITNNTDADEPIEIDLRWVGDAGTTKSYGGEMDSVVVEPGGEVEVDVDLGAVSPNLDAQQFAGQVHVVARPHAVNGEVPDQVASPPLYFHQEGGVTLAYDEEALLNLHRAGDFDGLSPRTADLMASEEDSALVRVLADEPEDGAAEPMVMGESWAGGPEGPLPSGTTPDALTQSPDPQFGFFSQPRQQNLWAWRGSGSAPRV